jgi:type II secretion system protein H
MNGKRRHGFTLLELTVVMIILAVMAAMAMPSFYEFYKETEARQVMQQLTQLLRFARQEAIFKRENKTVAIDFERHAFYINHLVERGWYVAEVRPMHFTKLPDGYEFMSVYLAGVDEEFDSEEATLTFRPNGTADQAKIEVRRVDEEGRTENVYVIRVNGTTGNIKVREKKDDEDSYY